MLAFLIRPAPHLPLHVRTGGPRRFPFGAAVPRIVSGPISAHRLRWLSSILVGLSVLLSGCSPSGPVAVEASLTQAQTPEGLYISWEEHRIDDEDLAGGVRLRGADGLQMADLDKDGIADIVSVHEDSSHVRVAFGSEDLTDWFRLSLAEGAEARSAEDAAIGDLNGDGYLDIMIACEKGHLLYLQNPAARTPGNKVRGWRWDRVIPEVTRGRGSFIRVFFADLDGDGRLEVVAANKGSGRSETASADKPATEMSWFEPPEDPLSATGWHERVLAQVKVPINAQPVDLDLDGDIDILGGSRGESRLLWFENQGRDDNGELQFLTHPVNIETGADAGGLGPLTFSGFNMAFHDLSGDGKLDVVLPAMPHAAGWIEQPAEPSEVWKFHLIGDIEPDELVAVTLADINGDGHEDLMTGAYSRGPRLQDGEETGIGDRLGRIAWFENPASASGSPSGQWTRHDILRRKRGMFDAFIARDMDDDGDVDFVGTRGNSGTLDGVFWLEQRRTETPLQALEPARKRDSQSVPLPLDQP